MTSKLIVNELRRGNTLSLAYRPEYAVTEQPIPLDFLTCKYAVYRFAEYGVTGSTPVIALANATRTTIEEEEWFEVSISSADSSTLLPGSAYKLAVEIESIDATVEYTHEFVEAIKVLADSL